MTDAAFQLSEQATYCKEGDPKRPGLVGLPDFTTQQVCPEALAEPAEPVTSAYPDGWYVRIMFDELLDPSIETLVPILDDSGNETGNFSGSIADANPVTLECQSAVSGQFVNVSYDGYYSPSGNRVTWPVGPSLVIKPNDPTLIATGRECRVTLNDSVVDKSGEPVDAADRGPFTFSVAPIQVLAIDPADDPDAESPIDALQIYYENIYVQFNTAPDPASFCDEGVGMDECEFGFSPEIGVCSTSGGPCEVGGTGADCPGGTCTSGGFYSYDYSGLGGSAAEFGFGPNLPIQVGAADAPKQYSFFFKQGASIKDRCGAVTTFGAPSEDDQTLVHFAVDAFAPRGTNGVNIVTGEVPTPLKKPTFTMNNVVQHDSLDLTEWTLSPEPFLPPDSNTACTTNADCTADVENSTFGNTGGAECRMFGAPINGRRCVSRYATTPFKDGDWVLRGHYQLNTDYTLTIRANATFADFWGVPYMNPSDVTVTWKTQPAITLGSISPEDNEEVALDAADDTTTISLSFNQSMDVTTFTQGADFTITPAAPADLSIDATGCGPADTSCSLDLTGTFAAGTYQFTLKAGAQISDFIGNTYTHPADTVINFTVVVAPSTPAQCL